MDIKLVPIPGAEKLVELKEEYSEVNDQEEKGSNEQVDCQWK